MRRWLVVGVAAVVLVVAAGLVATFIPRLRRAADALGCTNSLREIGLFAAHHADPKVGVKPERFPTEIPAGTVPLAGVPPEGRVSWLPRVLPGLDQRRQPAEPVVGGLKPLEPFAAEANQAVARVRVLALLCPANVPPADPTAPAPTSYVGVAGLGADAATVELPDRPPAPPRAGCFRYDRPTPFAFVTDGLSQTLLLGERSADLGPWLRGGPATVRGLDDSPAAPPLLAPGGQFGGNHATVSNWGFADGSVRPFTDRTDPKVLFDLATIAGKGTDPLPGE